MPAGAAELGEQLQLAVTEMAAWMREYGDAPTHPAQDVDLAELATATAELRGRLRDNYPFHHPRYAAQMLKPPHPAAVIGYVTAMLVNPNNHALDGGPATAAMEKDVVAQLAAMFGYSDHLGHLTSSGTIANLEALFVARETHPGKGIAHSADAHYTHARMAHLLGIEAVAVPTVADGTMDLDALDRLLAGGRVGTVVATTGTTGLGAVDPVHEIVPIARRHGVRVHVDAAYGGFFRLIADDAADGVAAAPYLAIADCDSVVIDPHKHGLQPYGCGAVLFRDPGVARHFLHDSPYTYFTSDELHLGEISLECSRAGAAAAALWLTLRLLPLTAEGLGGVLRPGRRAALEWARLIEASDHLRLYQEPAARHPHLLPGPWAAVRDRRSECRGVGRRDGAPAGRVLAPGDVHRRRRGAPRARPRGRGGRADGPDPAQRADEARERGGRAGAARAAPRTDRPLA